MPSPQPLPPPLTAGGCGEGGAGAAGGAGAGRGRGVATGAGLGAGLRSCGIEPAGSSVRTGTARTGGATLAGCAGRSVLVGAVAQPIPYAAPNAARASSTAPARKRGEVVRRTRARR